MWLRRNNKQPEAALLRLIEDFKVQFVISAINYCLWSLRGESAAVPSVNGMSVSWDRYAIVRAAVTTGECREGDGFFTKLLYVTNVACRCHKTSVSSV